MRKYVDVLMENGALFFIVMLFGIFVLLLLVIVSVLNRRAILSIHTLINSRLDQLLNLTQSASHAEGMRDQQSLNEKEAARHSRSKKK